MNAEEKKVISPSTLQKVAEIREEVEASEDSASDSPEEMGDVEASDVEDSEEVQKNLGEGEGEENPLGPAALLKLRHAAARARKATLLRQRVCLLCNNSLKPGQSVPSEVRVRPGRERGGAPAQGFGQLGSDGLRLLSGEGGEAIREDDPFERRERRRGRRFSHAHFGAHQFNSHASGRNGSRDFA